MTRRGFHTDEDVGSVVVDVVDVVVEDVGCAVVDEDEGEDGDDCQPRDFLEAGEGRIEHRVDFDVAVVDVDVVDVVIYVDDYGIGIHGVDWDHHRRKAGRRRFEAAPGQSRTRSRY